MNCKKIFYSVFFLFIAYNFSIGQVKSDIKASPKVGLVLSGGGAKGFAHVEVIKAIEQAGIKIDYISGTSMGAIVGALYASGYSPENIKEIINNVDFMELFLQEKNRNFIPLFDKSYKEKYILSLSIKNFKLNLPSAISTGQGALTLLSDLLYNVHDIHDYSKLPIPFLCIATNLENGNEEQMESGFLPLSVLASGAYPSLVEPVKIGDKVFVDGGIVNNFPARALKEKGMDIIIGVDLGSGLQKADEIKSILGIVNQIISYRINMRTDFEKTYVDLLVKPDLKDYTVTDFDKKDSILYKGRLAAVKAMPELKKIATLQGYDTIKRPRIKELPNQKYLFITKLEINSNAKYNTKYIKRKMGIEVPQNISIKKLDKGVSALFSTGNYNRVYYKISNDSTNENQYISINLNEKNNNAIKFGVHYDDIYKASLLSNTTLNKLILKNSTVSLDVVFSRNFRGNINYFIDNGVYPSIGSNTNFTTFTFDFSDIKKSQYKINRIRNFNHQLYFQSAIKEKYAIGVGAEYNYSKFTPFKNNPDFKTSENYIISPFIYIKADTRDNANFPFRGIKLNLVAKQALLSENDNKFSIIKGSLNYSIPIGSNFYIENQGNMGVSFNEVPMNHKYFLGGYFEQNFTNFKKFLGLPFAYISGNQLLNIYSSLNYKILKNHYIKAYVDFANIENKFKDIRYFDFKYSSYGIGYGYDSPLGPINLTYTYSVNNKNYLFNIGLGYWF